jgi:translation initiation factor 5A
MSNKLIDATAVRNGTTILIENEPCTVRSYDISKTGKHGHAKVRLEAIGIFDGKKRVMVKPGHERFEVPMINKRKAQVLSVGSSSISVMDTESFETIELSLPNSEDVEGDIKEGIEIEYWEIEGRRAIKRIGQ